ncbi:hypothetical protein [Arthrobacter pityocampae]|uniref:hypothetical protein n=1 Tax=Arthrobacter pityocampae TaxID=547334 RepID=UPI0037351329
MALTVTPVLDDPCPRAGVTVTGLLPGEQVVSVWRTADGKREAVRGARTIPAVDSFYVEDYEVPLGISVTYELDVVTGADAGVQGVRGDVVIDSEHGYIQDAANPATAIQVRGSGTQGVVLRAGSFKRFGYEADVSTFRVLGDPRPVTVSSPRGAPTGIPLEFRTMSDSESAKLRDLISTAVLLVIRPSPRWGSAMPSTATYSASSITESPVLAHGLTRWETTGDIVRGSSARILVPLWSYQDVGDIFATYDQKQAAAGAGTYLDDQKNPANA